MQFSKKRKHECVSDWTQEIKEVFQGKKRKHECVSDWAALPNDLLGKILNNLISIYDHLNFSLVCKPWSSFSLHHKHERHRITSMFPQRPMLIVPSNDGFEHGKKSLYDFTNNKICDPDFKLRYNKRCFGSSHGWLIMLGDTVEITLSNPFLGRVIHLPPVIREMNIFISEQPYYYPYHFKKSILTKDPLLYPNDYMVVVIYGDNNRLAVIKENDETWTDLNPKGSEYFEDVNVHNGVIYALDLCLRLWKIGVEDRDDGTSTFSLNLMVTLDLDLVRSIGDYTFTLVYVVESSRGDLFLVQRFIETPYGEKPNVSWTVKFKVYKLEDGMKKHTEVKSLDSDAMFIGYNHSMSISTKDFPQCLPNRIYYTDNFLMFGSKIGAGDVGIFNLEDESFDTHYKVNPAHKKFSPPIWIIPTLL